jgi:alkanesulfonate monooxygenase SsuD/methylene tetrahydromethanopterin reductase-like flavin-dependent oxidoreductase (luciferase family)
MIGGGEEKKTLRLVARYGDACNLFATSPEDVAHKLDVLRGHCDEADRDYDTVRRTITYSGAAATEEDMDGFTHDIEPYAELGIDTVIISPHLGATLRWMETFAATDRTRLKWPENRPSSPSRTAGLRGSTDLSVQLSC